MIMSDFSDAETFEDNEVYFEDNCYVTGKFKFHNITVTI